MGAGVCKLPITSKGTGVYVGSGVYVGTGVGVGNCSGLGVAVTYGLKGS